MRRGERQQNKKKSDLPSDSTLLTDNGDGQSPPPAKRSRADEDILTEEGEYLNNKYLIQSEWEKSKPKLLTLKDLMDATFKRRREWISEDCPSANTVLETYPCLASGKIVSEANIMLPPHPKTVTLIRICSSVMS